MSAGAEVFQSAILAAEEPAREVRSATCAPATSEWADKFAQEQLRSLVRRVFFPGWPRPAKQVVFAGVEEGGQAAAVCWQAAQILVQEVPGTVALVEAATRSRELEKLTLIQEREWSESPGSFEVPCKRLAKRLFAVPAGALGERVGDECTSAWLRDRIHQMRHDFDYCIVHAPALGRSSQPALLGQLCDGVVLVLEAQRTRRASALQAQKVLRDANARLIGTVLSRRQFPIPEGLYRRL